MEPKPYIEMRPQNPGGCRRTDRSVKDKQRSTAKIGMTVSLGALVVTGLMQGRGARLAHIASGVALIGFSAWHQGLYRPSARK